MMKLLRSASVVAIAMLAIVLTGCPLLPVVMTELENINQDTTLRAGTYIARQNIRVDSGAKLTLQPGVKIVFEQGRTMSVQDGARLYAVGTESNPIIFTGVESERGYWGGLRLRNTNSVDNQLEHVIFEYGGGSYDANLHITGMSTSPTRVAINHCTFRHSAMYGLSATGRITIDAFEKNALTNNQMGAANIDATHVGFLDDSSSFEGNDDDIVLVDGRSVDADATWPGIDADYLITARITVNAALTIDPGAVLVFDSGARLRIDSSGSLVAKGGEDLPIFFTGAEALPGFWGGLHFNSSNSSANELAHVVIEYGGGDYAGNLHLSGTTAVPSRVAIANSTFRHSKGYGISTDNNAIITAFSENILTENQKGAAVLSADIVRYLDATSTYVGNDIDVLHIDSGHVNNAATWSAIDVPYYFGASVNVNAAMEILPGAVLVFGSGRGMSVDRDGSLTAIGAADLPIVFTGAEPTQGYWRGLRFNETSADANILRHVIVEFGGGYYNGNVHITGTSTYPVRVHVTNSRFENSGSWGISLSGTFEVNDDIDTANDFKDNADGDITGL